MIEQRRMTASRMLCLGLGIAAATVLIALFLMSTDTAAAQDSNTGPVEGRQPIVENQFTTTGAGAIANRRPGLYIQQGIAVNNGDTSYFTGVPEEDPSFFADTFDQLFQQTLTSIEGVLDLVNSFIQSLGSGGGSSGGITFIPPSNSVTTWQSGSVSVQ